MNTTGMQQDDAIDFLNAQGSVDGNGTSPDTNLFSQGLDSGSPDPEDPVARGQSYASKVEMFVPRRPLSPLPWLKRGAQPSGAIPNRTCGAHRIP